VLLIDEQAAREETPGSLDRVFLDSAGSSLPPRRVVHAVVQHINREAAVGGYRAAAERAGDLAQLKESLGRLLGCEARSIALADSCTRAWTQFVHAIPFTAGDRVLIGHSEYANNALNLLRLARSAGVRIEIIPDKAEGGIDLDRMEDLMDERVRLVSAVHVPSNGGLVNPVREIADIAHAHGALVLLDASQSVGQLVTDVRDLAVDGLAGTGRKWLRGPRGTGFLFVRPGLARMLEPAVLDQRGATWLSPQSYEWRDDATRFELSESNIAALLGLKAAAEYLLELSPAAVQSSVSSKAEHLRSGLASIAGVKVHDLGRVRSGIVSFTVAGIHPAAATEQLWDLGIAVASIERSNTLLDMADRHLEGIIRASPHYFVANDQLDQALEAVRRLAKRL
jgi:selenocysteine lyase/cysteine desulfurase